MKISIPVTKRKFSDNACLKKALRSALKKHSGMIKNNNYSYRISGLVYYPYWLLEINAYKMRFFITKEARRKFFVTCDAMKGDFIVIPNVPATKDENVSEDHVIAERISIAQIKGAIRKEAIEDRINRQFIFGKPRTETGELRKIYLPMVEIFINNEGIEGAYYVNVYTGEVKEFV